MKDFGKIKFRLDKVSNIADFVGREIRRRAAAKVHLLDFAILRDQRRKSFDFFFEVIVIRRNRLAVVRHEHITAAEIAQFFAKRKMKIKRNRTRIIV